MPPHGSPSAKSFIFKGMLFIACLFVIDKLPFFLTLRLESIFPALQENTGSLYQVYSGQINTQAIFIGSSRILLHFNPQIFTDITQLSAYNLGMQGADRLQQRFILERYLEHNSRPEIIILESDPWLLDSEHLSFRKEVFKPFALVSPPTIRLFADSPTELFSIPFSGINYAQSAMAQLLLRNRQQYRFSLINGAQLMIGTKSTDIAPTKDFQPDPKLYQNELHFINYLSAQDFSIVLIQAPFHTQDSPRFSPRVQAAYQQLLNQLLTLPSVHYLDYSQDKEYLSRPDLFFDSDHLNLQGANLLTAKLARDINSLELQ